MTFFALLLLCIQACLVQDVYSKCIGSYPADLSSAAALTPLAPFGEALGLLSAPFAASGTIPFTDPFLADAAADHFGAYGGVGTGAAWVVGEIPTVGTTVVAGQIPIIGGVQFGGIVPGAGTITIAGSCACGCVGPL